MNILYRIKRISDNKYYKGKSKFNNTGRYYDYNSINQVVQYLLNMYTKEELIVCAYSIDVSIESSDVSIVNKLIGREYIYKEYIDKNDTL